MVRYTRNRVFGARGKTLKTWEKTKIYRDIRSYEKYDKNIIYMPRQDFVKWVKMLKNKGFWGYGESFHL